MECLRLFAAVVLLFQSFVLAFSVNETSVSLNGCLSVEPADDLTTQDREIKIFNSHINPSDSIKLRIDSICLSTNNVTHQEGNYYFNQIIDLTIENVHLSGFIADLIENMTRLESLSLVNTGLIELPDFDNFKNLKRLVITGNQLDNVTSKVFHGLDQLRVLTLSNNNIENLADDCFNDLIHLEELSLDNNRIHELHEDTFAKNVRLKVLDLTDFVEKRGYTINLDKIIFKENHNLETLILKRNSIENMHRDIFANLTRLKTLDLSSNALIALDRDWFKSMHNLEVLKLLGVMIFKIDPVDFGRLENLRDLDLRFCKINRLTNESFNGLPSLQTLNLFGSDLSSVAPETRLFSRNQKLKTINLTSCSISKLSVDWFLDLPDLETVDLRRNLLVDLTYADLYRFTFHSKDVTFHLNGNDLARFYFRSSESLLGSNGSTVIVNVDRIEMKRVPCDFDYVKSYTETQTEAQRKIKLIEHEKTGKKRRNLTHQTDPKTLIHQNQCSCEGDYTPCSCYYNDRHINLNCQNLRENDFFIDRWSNLKSYRDFTISLDLSNGNFKSLPEGAWQFDSRIVQLNFSDNQLSHNALQLNWSERFPAMKTLDLRRNELQQIPLEFSTFLLSGDDGGRNLTLYLDRNRFGCECTDNVWIASLNSNVTDLIVDYEEIYCSFDGIANSSLSWAVSNLTDTCISMNEMSTHKEPSTTLIMLIIIGLVSGVVASASFMAVRRSKRLRNAQFRRNLQLEAQTPLLKYDAFISYSHKDEEFVINDLVPNLENPSDGSAKYKLCLHERDWLAGEWILDQINQSIATSHRTIIVLSENFIESFWGQHEFRMAYQQVVQSKQRKLIVIIKDEVPDLAPLDEDLRHFIANNTYLKWSDPSFWRRLREALPASNISCKENKSANSSTYLVS